MVMSNLRAKRIALLVALVFALGAVAMACAPEEVEEDPVDEPDDEPRYGGTFVVSMYSDITHMNPFMHTDGASNIVSSVIHQGLIGYRHNNEITALLAEDWDVSEDGLTWTFYLREGVKWHDGEEFTAEDVAYTYELILDPETASPRRADFTPIDRVEVLDDYTLEVVTEEPYASLLDKVGTRGIVAKHHVEEHGLEDYNQHPLGTGPFEFEEWQPDDKIVLSRFDDYWEGKPYLEELEFVVIPEPSVRQMAMETGEVHFNWWGVPDEDIPAMQESDDIEVLQYLQTDFHMLILNNNHPFFEDYRARQAIAHAIDQDAIVDNFAEHSGVVGYGPYSEAYGDFYNPDVLTKFPYDPDKALDILGDLGWEENDDGVLEDEDGEEFEFDAMVRAGDEQRINELVMMQSWLRDIGIKMNIQELEWSLVLERLTETREYDACIVQFGASPDPDHYTIFHPEGGFWIGQYDNERVNELLEKGRSVIDPEEREVYYDEYQEITSYEQAVIFLYHSQNTSTVNQRFEGMKDGKPAGQMQLIHEVWDTEAEGE